MPDVAALYKRYGVRLRNTSLSNDGWVTVRCFTGAHQDRNPSARVNLKSGGFKCFTCGAKGGVLDALEILGERDRERARAIAIDYGILELETPKRRLRPAQQPRPAAAPTAAATPKRTPVTASENPGAIDYDNLTPKAHITHDRTWTYTDQNGAPVGRVRRQDISDGRKRIWQERPQPDGTWAHGLEGKHLPLYQLPLIHAAAKQHRRILIVEGEKAVDALERIGLLATTSPGGAGKWRPEHTLALHGAHVTAIADSDLPGRQHAAEITSSCLNAGINTTMPLDLHPLLTDGTDIVDHLAAIAETTRAVTPEISAASLQAALRRNLEHELARLLPADPDAIQRLLEHAHYQHDPAGKTLATCPRCGQERPQRITHGITYCPCGHHQPAANTAAE